MTRSTTRMTLGLATLLLSAIAFAFGCGGEDPPTTPDPTPGGLTPLNDTPANTMLRFEKAYEGELRDEFTGLFTGDYHFTFSSQADPDLVTQNGLGFSREDERDAAQHLFSGFTNGTGAYVPGATAIALELPGITFVDDPTKPDSGAWYKRASLPSILLEVSIAGGEILEVVSAQDFYLVRGDVAFLGTGLPGSADRWYIRQWDDKSGPLPGAALRPAADGAFPAALTVTTWGRLKARYSGI